MGRKAKIKKIRQQQKINPQSSSTPKYNASEFVEQFQHMGYQLQIPPQELPATNRGNISPEIPQDKIEPQL